MPTRLLMTVGSTYILRDKQDEAVRLTSEKAITAHEDDTKPIHELSLIFLRTPF